MAKLKFEYIWLDGSYPTQGLRSKTKILDSNDFKAEPTPEELPLWSFDGSSTNQAQGGASDLLLKAVACYPDSTRRNGYLVMTEVLNADGTPHSTNARATIDDDDNDFWFGFEQEYTLWDNGAPIGFFGETGAYPRPQGPYYCGVGTKTAIGRHIVEEHMDICIDAGLNIEGINAEVMIGQWEYQIFAKGGKDAGDQIWVSRFLLERCCEEHGIEVNWEPKPVKGDWNGSGMHCNFSNSILRNAGNKETYDEICNKFGATQEIIDAHIAVYGADNDQRLTGKHETQAIDKFSYGISDRGASIRIPIATVESGWKGWLEDRRPASNACPYKVASRIIKTVKS